MDGLIKRIKCSKIGANASWIIGCRIIQSLLSLIITMITARYLGPSNYGIINYSASVVAFFVPIMQLGLNNIIVQEIVNNPEDESCILGSSLMMSFLSSLLCICGTCAFVFVANPGDSVTIVITLLYSILLITQSGELIQYWFQAKYLSKYISIISVIAYLLVSCYKIFLLVTQANIYWFAVSNALDYLFIVILSFLIYKKKGGKLLFSSSWAKKLFNKSKYYIIANMMVTIFSQTDKVMINLMLDSTQTGYYSAAIACATIPNFVFHAIIDSSRPLIFEKHKKSSKDFNNAVVCLYSVIIWMSLLSCLLVSFLSPIIINLLYGNDYLPSIDVLRGAIWYSTFSFIGIIRNIWILAEGQQKWLWLVNFSGVLINIILNYVMIPLFGIIGAAVASAATQFFTNIVISFLIKPLRPNIYLMLKGANPKEILRLFKNI